MTPELLGQFLALASAAAFSLASIFITRTKSSGGDKGVMFSVLVTMVISAAIWLALEFPGMGLPSLSDQGPALLLFVLAGVLAMVFGRSLGFESIRRLGVTRAAAVKRLIPFFSVILAALLLSEPLSGHDGLGMLAIAFSFGLLIRESLRARAQLAVDAPMPREYLFGVCSAAVYGAAYAARKAGLNEMAAPAFGTFVSAASGFAFYIVVAAVNARYRGYFAGMFRHADRWIFLAAVLISLGQIFLFAALAYEKVATVVMIASIEVFISIFLSVFVFRSERMPGPWVILAAALATAGVILVAME